MLFRGLRLLDEEKHNSIKFSSDITHLGISHFLWFVREGVDVILMPVWLSPVSSFYPTGSYSLVKPRGRSRSTGPADHSNWGKNSECELVGHTSKHPKSNIKRVVAKCPSDNTYPIWNQMSLRCLSIWLITSCLTKSECELLVHPIRHCRRAVKQLFGFYEQQQMEHQHLIKTK